MDQSVSVPLQDREETPLLGPSLRDTTKHSKRVRVRTVICLFALFVTGVFLGLHFRSAPEKEHHKATPVCNLDHAKSETNTNRLLENQKFQTLDFTFDEGVVGNIYIKVNDDPSIRDIVVTRTLRFSHPAIEQAYMSWAYYTAPRSTRAYKVYYSLTLNRRERQSILYEQHQCASVHIVILIPELYSLERLDVKSNYKGSIDIKSINVGTLNVKATHGDIYIRGTSAVVAALEAPGGSIDARVAIDTRLKTSSGGDTVVDFTATSWAELESFSEKRLTVMYGREGVFSLMGTNHPRLVKNESHAVNITHEDRHTLEGYIGARDYEFPSSLPRLTMTGHDTVLSLKSYVEQAQVQPGSSKVIVHGVGRNKYSSVVARA
ncbi:MAG: hypothetical protein BYD32DRAFT_414265 [Podila humilis]|nr:MAG: hypothetical protein BYD32DRAFT_414265 [Podila humilis]